MALIPTAAAATVERHACPECGVEPGSACRTHTGRVATKYHPQRITLVPKLAVGLEVLVPADRGPGHAWAPGLMASEGSNTEPPAAVAPQGGAIIRVGYAHCSAPGQELDVQLRLLTAGGCAKVFSERSPRGKRGPSTRPLWRSPAESARPQPRTSRWFSASRR